MSVMKQSTEEIRNISSINKDYVSSVERKEKRKKAHKVRLFRRLAAFAVIVALMIVWITFTMVSQSQALAAKEEEKEKVLEALQQVQDEQDMLNSQILKLNDDEYIAKLARKEYFLSNEGEIIFAIPENKENDSNGNKKQ